MEKENFYVQKVVLLLATIMPSKIPQKFLL